MSESVRVTVIIPCRNEERYIATCVEAVYNNDINPDQLLVIVADGLSTDSTRSILEQLKVKHPGLLVIDNTRQITPVAFNLGLKHAKGEYFITIGARSFISPNYLSTCVRILDEDPAIGCVGGIPNSIEYTERGRTIAKAMSTPFGVGDNNRSQQTSGYVDTVSTPMYRRKVLDEVGYFDEALVRNQDDELSYRILKGGYKIYQTRDIGIDYVTRGEFGKLFKQLFQYGFWKVVVNKKHKTVTTSRQLIPPMFVLYLALLVLTLPLMLMSCWFSLLLVPLALYIALALYAAFTRRDNLGEVPRFLYCFLIMHISYGLGYLKGLITVVVLNRSPSDTAKALTR